MPVNILNLYGLRVLDFKETEREYHISARWAASPNGYETSVITSRDNDELGHKRGDEVLLDAARIFNKSVRESDIVGRFGGDEFGVLLPNCDLDSAQKVLAKVVSSVKNQMSQKDLNVTASIGAVTFLPNNSDIEAVLHKADQVMYKVKKSGKNSFHVENL